MEEKKKLKEWQIGLAWGIAIGMMALCVCLILHQGKIGILLLGVSTLLGTILYQPLQKLRSK